MHNSRSTTAQTHFLRRGCERITLARRLPPISRSPSWTGLRKTVDLPGAHSVRPNRTALLREGYAGNLSGSVSSPDHAGDLMQPGELQSRQGTFRARKHYVQLSAQMWGSQAGPARSYAQDIEMVIHKPPHRPGVEPHRGPKSPTVTARLFVDATAEPPAREGSSVSGGMR